MSFSPAIPLSGFLGWRVFNQTEARQRDVFTNDALTLRNVDYFKENISGAATAVDLVNDRRLLTVALGAFGLSDEIDKKALIQRILEEGTEDSDAFANRINDQRWRDFSEQFGYGNFAGSRILLSSFREEIAAQYIDRSFEERVGEVDTDIRLAMNFRREIARIANNSSSDEVKWLQIMGQRPVRAVMEAALGLPATIGSVDLDQQRDIFMRKAEAIFGSNSPSIFSDPEVVEDALQRFFLRKEIENGPSASTPGMAALSILSAPPTGGAQTINLILSNALSRG
jgi:uncharacterized protein DUF1217